MTTKPEDALVELTPRQIAEKIAADARMRLICMKPEYDTIDMGEALIQRAITTLLERERRKDAALSDLLFLWDSYRESDLSHADAAANLVHYDVWVRARAALTGMDK